MDYQHQSSLIKNYMNVMELLVEEEVRHQTRNLSNRTAEVLRSSEIIAYALNQLPSLYATTQRGWEYQVKEGRDKYSIEITQAVRCAINAVLRDPIMSAVPLGVQIPSSLRKVLYELRIILRDHHLEWEDVPKAIERLFQDRVLYHKLSNQVAPLDLLERGESRPGYTLSGQKITYSLGEKKIDVMSVSTVGWNDPLAIH